MGIILRQSAKFSIINILGSLLGGISVLYIYPLDKELYGYAQMILSTSFLFLPLATFGIGTVVVKYFFYFQSLDSKKNGFFLLIVLLYLCCVVLFTICFFLLKDYFYALLGVFGLNQTIVSKNEFIILSLIILMGAVHWIVPYISNFRRIALPSFVVDLGFKFYFPILFLLTFYQFISVKQFAWFFPLFFFIVACILLAYLSRLRGLDFSWNFKVYKLKINEISRFFTYSSITSIANQLSMRLDTFMIPLIIGFSSNGLYSIVYFISNILSIPTNSIYKITDPIVSKSIEKNDISSIELLYKKFSTNLLLFGSFIFLILLSCLPDIFKLSSNPKAFIGAMPVFYFLGAAKLIDMITSINSGIISYSKYYKYNVLFISILGFSNIFLNFYLINRYGIVGASCATFIAILLFNIFKALFIYWKFNIHPFSNETIKVLITFFVAGVAIFSYNLDTYPIINIFYNVVVILSVYGITIYYFQVSKDAYSLLQNAVKYLKRYL